MKGATNQNNSIARWRDPIAFIEHCLIDPETSRPFILYAEQRTYLKHAFERTPDGHMRYTELVFSAGKKSGKSTLAALIIIYVAVVLAGVGGEINLASNDFEQSRDRIFKMVSLILQASPLLKDTFEITASKITFRSTNTIILALANEYRSFAGSNPTLNCYDELAYYTSEDSRRMFEEGIPSPARKISFRLSVSTAGFEGEPSPLRDLYDRAMEHGQEIAPDLRRHENLLCFWTNKMLAPWQREQWIGDQRRGLRPAQFARLIQNQWVSSESQFIDLAEWDACTDPSLTPILANNGLPIWAGLDLGLRHDSTALIACAWDGGRIRLVTHQVFIPRAGETLDIQQTAEAAVLSLRSRFALQAVYFDPWQGIALAQTLTRQNVRMVEWGQTPANLSLMAGNLLDLIKRRQFAAYADADLRLAVSKTVAIEGMRGWRLGKSKASDRVDPVIALAMAVIATFQAGGPVEYDKYRSVRPRPSVRDLDGNSSWATNRLNPNVDLGRIAQEEDAQSVSFGGRSRRFPGRGTW
jgi:phage terminase large subunit-like protein